MQRLTGLVLSNLIVLSVCAALAAQAPDSLKEAQRLTRVAQVAQQQGRYEDAIKAYETIGVIAKGSPKIAAAALVNAGNIYMATGKFADAAKLCRASLSLDPSSAEAQNNRGEA